MGSNLFFMESGKFKSHLQALNSEERINIKTGPGLPSFLKSGRDSGSEAWSASLGARERLLGASSLEEDGYQIEEPFARYDSTSLLLSEAKSWWKAVYLLE